MSRQVPGASQSRLPAPMTSDSSLHPVPRGSRSRRGALAPMQTGGPASLTWRAMASLASPGYGQPRRPDPAGNGQPRQPGYGQPRRLTPRAMASPASPATASPAGLTPRAMASPASPATASPACLTPRAMASPASPAYGQPRRARPRPAAAATSCSGTLGAAPRSG